MKDAAVRQRGTRKSVYARQAASAAAPVACREFAMTGDTELPSRKRTGLPLAVHGPFRRSNFTAAPQDSQFLKSPGILGERRFVIILEFRRQRQAAVRHLLLSKRGWR